VATVAGFLTPDPWLYDSAQDIYFVSNINGSRRRRTTTLHQPRAARGAVENLKFIEGGHNGSPLHAPKGMALRGDTLWLADIDAVRAFNAKTGAPVALADLSALGAVFRTTSRSPERRAGTSPTPHQVRDVATCYIPGRPDLSRWPDIDRNGRRPGRYARLAERHHPRRRGQRFIVVQFAARRFCVEAWGQGAQSVIARGPGGFDGVEIVRCKILVSSWNDFDCVELREPARK